MRALSQLNHAEVRRKLEDFHRSLESATPIVPITYKAEILDSFKPGFWEHCFVDLFYRGDC